VVYGYRVMTVAPIACLQGVQRQEPQEVQLHLQLPGHRICIPSLILPLIRSKAPLEGTITFIFVTSFLLSLPLSLKLVTDFQRQFNPIVLENLRMM